MGVVPPPPARRAERAAVRDAEEVVASAVDPEGDDDVRVLLRQPETGKDAEVSDGSARRAVDAAVCAVEPFDRTARV